MSAEFEQLKSTWQTLGHDDPLWAIVSHEAMRDGRWRIEEFLETGERDVAFYCDLLAKHTGVQPPFGHVLDFGCGVGRLARAWSERAREVTAVDISEPMLERAGVILASKLNVRLVLNEEPDLRCFSDESFDLVFSLICLQHMPWQLGANYVREFARVSRKDGLVAFQLPTRPLRSTWIASARKRIVDNLPFGLGRVYRHWRHGSAAVFDVFYTAFEDVLKTTTEAGLRLVHREQDHSAGPGVSSLFYIFRKHDQT